MGKEDGVTLTALVITIIITLILAGITINLTIGQDGIITKAQQAKKEMRKAEIKDTMKLDILTAETDAKIRGENLEKAQLNDIVAKYGELQEDGDTIITKEDKFEISLKEIWYGVLSDSGSYTDKVEQIEILEKEIADLKEQYEELKTLNEGNEETLQELNRQITELEEQKRALEEQVATLTSQNESLIGDNENLTNEKTRLEEALVKLNEEYQAFKKTEGTATAGDILNGKTAWVNGTKITGTMVNRGALNASLNAGQSYTIPAGYHNGSGKITANSLASQTQATATADNITEGKTAWVNGQLVTGTGVDNKTYYNLGINNFTSSTEIAFRFMNTTEGNKTYITPSDCDFLIAILSYSTAGSTKNTYMSISGLPNMVEIDKNMNYAIDNTTNGILIVYAYNVPAQTMISFSTDRNMRVAACYGFIVKNSNF